MKFFWNGQRRTILPGVFINSVAVILLFMSGAVQSLTSQVSDSSDKTHAICIKRCAPPSNSGERQSHEACMLRCRNYIEETMFRPRVLQSSARSNAVDAKARRLARATGAKNHMFVRVGRPSDSEDSDNLDAEKRSMQMRGSFVRIGRQLSDQSVVDDNRFLEDFNPQSEVTDIAKRRSGFVRIGRIGRRGPSSPLPPEQFVRIGRGDTASDDGVVDEDDELSNDKRGSRGQAFVRIGRKAANFVRIGRAFVRIGKKSDDGGLAPEIDSNGALAPAAESGDELKE